MYPFEPTGLNLVTRFNISRFLLKADDPIHRFISIDSNSGRIIHQHLPKVYHVNIILKTTFFEDDGKRCSELKKYRVVLDKNGIRRVECVKKPRSVN